MKKKVYVIANSHMDPIWLWRLRDGRSTWINTCRTVVRMMEKYPFLKFTRSSSSCYRWIEECDKPLFRKIARLVDAGRWEIVGGWVEQSDTIITPGESLIRQAEHGRQYFRRKFGRDIRIAYSVDSFGQNAGLPQILKRSGFDYYTFMRPKASEKTMPDSFRWRCTGEAGDVVTFRIRSAYCTPEWLNTQETFAKWFRSCIATDRSSLPVFFFGVGDHGGGIYENQLLALLKLQDQYDLEFCTLEHYFHRLEKCNLPVVEGELTHHSPGCYSAGGMVKECMADCEKNLAKAEKLNLQLPGPAQKAEAKKLDAAWEKLLFYYFHDIYSGTCIRDAFVHEIRDGIGAVNDIAVESMERSLCRIGSAVPSRGFMNEGGVLLWNPNSFAGRCVSWLDTFLDPNVKGSEFNCLRTADGREIPLQAIRGASAFGPGPNWGRIVVLDDLSPSEVKHYAYSRTEKKFPALGFSAQKALLKKLSFAVLADDGDTWGHGLKRLGKNIGKPELVRTEEMADGPVVSQLRLHYRWRSSEFRVDLFRYAGIAPVYAFIRTDWHGRKETLKAVLRCRKKIVSTVSGQASAILRRTADECEQPFLDWVAAEDGSAEKSGFLVHAMHGYDVTEKDLRLTVLRPVIYAEHTPYIPCGDEGDCDLGQQERAFWCFAGDHTDEECARLAEERLMRAEYLEITACDGQKKFRFDRWEVKPASVIAQSERILPDGSAGFRLLNLSEKPVTASILKNGKLQKQIRLAGRAFTKLVFHR